MTRHERHDDHTRILINVIRSNEQIPDRPEKVEVELRGVASDEQDAPRDSS